MSTRSRSIVPGTSRIGERYPVSIPCQLVVTARTGRWFPKRTVRVDGTVVNVSIGGLEVELDRTDVAKQLASGSVILHVNDTEGSVSVRHVIDRGRTLSVGLSCLNRPETEAVVHRLVAEARGGRDNLHQRWRQAT